MARHDVKIREAGGLNSVTTVRYQTEAASTAIYAGEPVKLKAAGSPYMTVMVDADFTLGTDIGPIGIAASDGTHTASADGYVDVYVLHSGIVYEAKAKTAANVATTALINAMCGDRKIFDLTSGSFTVDDGAADAVGNPLLIVGGDPTRRVLYFQIRPFVNAVDGA